ncbi:hypothetical protein ACLOJK_014983, partial [Asimina triloba]
TGENWPTLSTTATAPRPSRRAISAIPAASPVLWRLHKASSIPIAATTAPRTSQKITPTPVVATPILAIRPPCKVTISATPAPRSPCKVISASTAATTAPRSLHDASSADVVASLTLASRPLQKAVITAVTSATRSVHETSPIFSLRSSRLVHTQFGVKVAKRSIRKTSPASRRTTRLNCEDAQPLPPSPHYGVSRPGSRQRRMAPTTTPKEKVTIATKRENLPPGWRYLSRQHSTYPRLVADYW